METWNGLNLKKEHGTCSPEQETPWLAEIQHNIHMNSHLHQG